jgi:hypothetical protein
MPITALAAILLATSPAPGSQAFVFQGADGGTALAERINLAIERGVAWLQKSQKPDGTWDDIHNKDFPAGVAALGFLTLVKSGVGESAPSVQRCIKYFDEYRAFEKTYSTGVLLLAWEALKRGPVDRPKAEAGAKWLIQNRDPTTRLWAYPGGEVDLSNTQYALLGLHAASRMGVEVDKQFLFESLQAVVKRQQKENSFTYRNPLDDIGTGSMTTAAIFAFRLAASHLKGFPAYEGARLDWEAKEKTAFEWLEKHYRVDMNPAGYTSSGGMRGWHYYYLYGLERACDFAGKRKLGNHNWYVEGAEFLVAKQEADGKWRNDFVDTCFALLFLKRATLTWTSDGKTSEGKRGPDEAPPVPANEASRPAPKAANAKVPFIQSWYVCGPFNTKKGKPFGDDEIGETTIKFANEDEKAGGSIKRWKKVETPDRVLIFERVMAPFDRAMVYAFTTIKATKDQDAILWIGHDDGAQAWLNGKQIYENETYGEAAGVDTYFARVKLKKGDNPFLVKVFDTGYDCGLCARFATPDGGPIE